MSKPRVLVADDHAVVVEGVRTLLEPQFELLGVVEDGRSLVAAAQESKPDVIVLDISMPLLNGVEAARQIRKTDQRVKFVFLTMHPDVAYVKAAFRAGASGYVLKRAAVTELVAAMKEALKGRKYLSPLITNEELHVLLQESGKAPSGDVLTSRQREVLQLVAEGHSMKEIASMLNISAKTVAFHKYRIMDQLQIETTPELVHYAVRHGVVSE